MWRNTLLWTSNMETNWVLSVLPHHISAFFNESFLLFSKWFLSVCSYFSLKGSVGDHTISIQTGCYENEWGCFEWGSWCRRGCCQQTHKSDILKLHMQSRANVCIVRLARTDQEGSLKENLGRQKHYGAFSCHLSSFSIFPTVLLLYSALWNFVMDQANPLSHVIN